MSPVYLRLRTIPALLLALTAASCGVDSAEAPATVSSHTAALGGDMEVHVINVGQGHATLVVGPDGTTLLVDAGKSSTVASTEIEPYLAALGLPAGSTLDYAVATHLDADHIRGFTYLINNESYDFGTAVYDNGSNKTGVFITDFKNAVAGTTAGPVQPIPLGTVIPLGGGATATCVAVHGEVLEYGPVAGVSDENDWSVVLLVEYGDFDFILGGDLGGGDDDSACTGRVHSSTNVETPLADTLVNGAAPLLGPDGVEAMLINHHGSHSSTNSDWMNLLTPNVAIIGVGANSYGHPREVVVDNVLLGAGSCIAATPALVLQTDEGDVGDPTVSLSGFVVGDVVITTSGNGSYDVSASGDVVGPDERAAAGIPTTFTMDEGAGGGCTSDPECDDGDACNGAETCNLGTGVCQAGTPLSCDDGDACNGAETCDPATGCEAGTPLTCDDGNVCNGTETCNPATGCEAGTPLSCDDGNACNGAETCDPVAGCGAGTPPTCDDGDMCNGLETCNPATGCEAGTPLVCDDGNACNGTETCDPVAGCGAGIPLTCDDGSVCTGTESCNPASGCEAGTPLNCDLGNDCESYGCDAVNGCFSSFVPSGTPCQGGAGLCDGAGTCEISTTMTLAYDGWESNDFGGGSGWSEDWTVDGDVRIGNNASPYAGGYHVRFRRGNGHLERPIDLSGVTGATLRFWARVESFESTDTFEVLVSSDGSSFTPVWVLDDTVSDDTYHYYEIDLTGFTMTSNFTIAFDGNMSARSDRVYVDEIEIIGTP